MSGIIMGCISGGLFFLDLERTDILKIGLGPPLGLGVLPLRRRQLLTVLRQQRLQVEREVVHLDFYA